MMTAPVLFMYMTIIFKQPIKSNFHTEPPLVGGTKDYTLVNGPSHIIKMAATPIYVKSV